METLKILANLNYVGQEIQMVLDYDDLGFYKMLNNITQSLEKEQNNFLFIEKIEDFISHLFSKEDLIKIENNIVKNSIINLNNFMAYINKIIMKINKYKENKNLTGIIELNDLDKDNFVLEEDAKLENYIMENKSEIIRLLQKNEIGD